MKSWLTVVKTAIGMLLTEDAGRAGRLDRWESVLRHAVVPVVNFSFVLKKQFTSFDTQKIRNNVDEHRGCCA